MNRPVSQIAVITIILGLVLCSGCARFDPKPLSAEANANALDNRTLDNPELKAFLETNLHRTFDEWPERRWDFEMLSLAAFYYQPDLAVVRAQWEGARAGIKTAGARPNPTLNLVPGYNFNHINAQYQTQPNGSLSRRLINWSKRRESASAALRWRPMKPRARA